MRTVILILEVLLCANAVPLSIVVAVDAVLAQSTSQEEWQRRREEEAQREREMYKKFDEMRKQQERQHNEVQEHMKRPIAYLPQKRTLTQVEKSMISKAVTDDLIDPQSARFTWPFPLVQREEYCGLVNARNRMGGYNGDAPFMATLLWRQNKVVAVEGAVIGDADIKSVSFYAVVDWCNKRGYRFSVLDTYFKQGK